MGKTQETNLRWRNLTSVPCRVSEEIPTVSQTVLQSVYAKVNLVLFLLILGETSETPLVLK